jgi:sugar-specific transcriptional regulator TrmB
MNEAQAIQNLIDLGMNEREARLYVGMLRLPEATPAMLHRISGVPRTKTYETLDRMVSLGICSERQEGRQRYFRATRPSDVYALLRKNWDQEHQHKCQLAEEAFDSLDVLFLNSSATDPSLDQIEVIRSKEQINVKFLSLMNATKSEVLSFTRSPYAAADEQTRTEVKNVQKKAFARGIGIRTVYMVETDLENATPVVYLDEPSGWTVVWVVEQDNQDPVDG